MGLIVLDEVQQIGDAAVEPYNKIWNHSLRDGTPLATAFLDAMRQAVVADGVIVRGLDAGLSRMGQEWLGLPVYDCVQIRPDKAPVTVYEHRGLMLDALWRALDDDGIIYVTSDRKDVCDELAREVTRRAPRRRLLVIHSETVDPKGAETYDPRAVAFLKDPNAELHKYDVVITSPTMVSGVSIKADEARYVFQFCSNLTPKDNLQMLNRFRRQGHVYVWYGGMRAVGDVRTPEEALKRAETLRTGLPYAARSEKAVTIERLRHWSELDKLYQSFDPAEYYMHQLEKEGRDVEFVPDYTQDYRLADDGGALASDKDWANQHWPEQEYDALRTDTVERRVHLARLKRREVEHKTLGGWKMSHNLELTTRATEDISYRALGIAEVATGRRERPQLLDQLALDRDTPPSYLRDDDAIIVLLHGLKIIGYRGENAIPAERFVEQGARLLRFLENNADYWNAIFPKANWFERSGDDVADARKYVKHLLSLVGLKMRRGRLRRIETGARVYDAAVEDAEELKHLLYLRACGQAGERLPEGIELIFTEEAHVQRAEANQQALAWYRAQDAKTQDRVYEEIPFSGVFAAACAVVEELQRDAYRPF